MSIIDIILLAIALSVDSFDVALSVGTYPCTSYRTALKMGLIFALFQGIFPVLGACVGMFFQDTISQLDHWIAFAILFIIGIKVLIEFIRAKPEDKMFDVNRWFVLIGLAVATSIDSFMVGIGLGLDMGMERIPLAGCIIFSATFLFTFLGVHFGKVTKRFLSRWAGIFGGCILIFLSVKILFEHHVIVL